MISLSAHSVALTRNIFQDGAHWRFEKKRFWSSGGDILTSQTVSGSGADKIYNAIALGLYYAIMAGSAAGGIYRER